MVAGQWHEDVLPGFATRTLPLPDDEFGPAQATLVRPRHQLPGAERVALYLHGWNAYFHHEGLADFFTQAGIAFYALDLRRYGRSLRAGEPAGYVADLSTYDEDIAAALAVIGEEQPGAQLIMTGHSTGGLTATLWAERHPGRAAALALISPWLELQGSVPARLIVTPALSTLRRLDPLAKLPQVDPGFYGRTMHRDLGGSWSYRLDWQPSPQFPVRAGWLRAVTAGHARIAAGLHLTCPVLVLLAAESLFSARWRERMRRTDIVIDVAVTAERATRLAGNVTIVRIEDAMHDIPLSEPRARERSYRAWEQWLSAYLPASVPAAPRPGYFER